MILSHKEIEDIASAVVKDFNAFFYGADDDDKRKMPRGTPIDRLAKDYLGLDVSFIRLSSDGSLCGVTAYSDTEYVIEELGVKRTVQLKRNQVLLDASFMEPGQIKKLCGKRRFTLSHECAHQILYPDVLNIDQMCEILSVSTKTGYKIIKSGSICCLKVGRAYRIPKAHLFSYLCIGMQNASAEA